MPKMTHWNSPEPVDVAPEKVEVYVAQGWVSVDRPSSKVQPAVVRESVSADPEAKPAKKVAAKKTAKKAAKKS